MIATITPQGSQQANLLANALNSTTSGLTQALNNAIQRSQQDVELQSQQGAAFLSTQTQQLNRRQEERFDLRNRAENTRDFNERQRTNEIVNDGRVQEQAIRSENQSELRQQREILSRSNATPADRAVFGFENQQTDDARLRSNNADTASQVIQDNNFQQSEQAIAQDTNTTQSQVRANRESERQEDRAIELPKRDANINARNESDNEVTTTLSLFNQGQIDFADEPVEKLTASLDVINNSLLSNDPDVIRMRDNIIGVLQDKGINAESNSGVLPPLKPEKPLTVSQQGQLDTARIDLRTLEGQLSRIEDPEIEVDKVSDLENKIAKARATIERLGSRSGASTNNVV